MNVIDKVIEYAGVAHGDQKRKYGGDRYIVHPVRVMELVRSVTDDITVLSAAILHDVLEDTTVKKDGLLNFLKSVMSPPHAQKTLSLVIELTDIYTHDAFPGLNRKKRKFREAERISNTSKDAQTIKYADIIDNCLDLVHQAPEFAPLFLKETDSLLKYMDKGDAGLYKKALQIVQEQLNLLDDKGPV